MMAGIAHDLIRTFFSNEVIVPDPLGCLGIVNCAALLVTSSAFPGKSRSDLENDLLPDLNRPGLGAPGLGYKGGLCAGHWCHTALSGLAVISRNGRSSLENVLSGFFAGPCFEKHMTARRASDVKPPVSWFGHFDAQSVIVNIGFPGQDRPYPVYGIRPNIHGRLFGDFVCPRYLIGLAGLSIGARKRQISRRDSLAT